MYLINPLANELGNGVSEDKVKLKPVDAPIYRYYEALYMSFYNKRLYIDVAKRWKGLGIAYLLLALLIGAVPFALRTSFDFNRTFNEQILDPLYQLPVFYIQNGEVSFDKPMPYMIKNRRGDVVLIVDTTGKVNSIDSEYPFLSILINKDRITMRIPAPELFLKVQSQKSAGLPFVEKFNKGVNLVFDGRRVISESSVSLLKYFSQALVYPLVVALFFSLYLVIFAVLGFLGQLYSSIFFSLTLTFAQSMRLLIVSATPMMYLFFLALTLNAVFPGAGFILIAVMVAYFSFALLAYRSEAKQLVNQ